MLLGIEGSIRRPANSEMALIAVENQSQARVLYPSKANAPAALIVMQPQDEPILLAVGGQLVTRLSSHSIDENGGLAAQELEYRAVVLISVKYDQVESDICWKFAWRAEQNPFLQLVNASNSR